MSFHMDKDFADWLIEKMNDCGWNQSELARKVGVTRQLIETYVNRKRRKYDPAILTKIAKGLNEPQEVVFRAAGLLKPVSPVTEQKEKLLYLFDQLPADEKEDLLSYIQIKITLLKRSGKIKSSLE